MGTLAKLPTLPSKQSDGAAAEGSLQNAAAGYLRILEAACRTRIMSRYPASRRWQEKEFTYAILKEAEGELLQLRSRLKQMLEAMRDAAE